MMPERKTKKRTDKKSEKNNVINQDKTKKQNVHT